MDSSMPQDNHDSEQFYMNQGNQIGRLETFGGNLIPTVNILMVPERNYDYTGTSQFASSSRCFSFEAVAQLV